MPGLCVRQNAEWNGLSTLNRTSQMKEFRTLAEEENDKFKRAITPARKIGTCGEGPRHRRESRAGARQSTCALQGSDRSVPTLEHGAVRMA